MLLSGTVAEGKIYFCKVSTEPDKGYWVMRKFKLDNSVTEKLKKVHSLQKAQMSFV